MHVTVTHYDRERYHYFGISDFNITEQGDSYLEYYDDVEGHTRHIVPDEVGDITSAVSEASYDEADVSKTLADILADETATVIVGATTNHTHVTNAALALDDDPQIEGELTINDDPRIGEEVA